MPILEVPFYFQINDDACGAAALKMVYKYFRPSKLSKFSQEKVFRNLLETDPHHAQKVRITTDDIVATAHRKGFSAKWGRVSTNKQELVEQLRFFIEEQKIPVIACQRSAIDPLLGHFRVIIGINGDEVILHDPDRANGGKAIKWSVENLLDQWKSTGKNVTGGVLIWIAKKPIDDPLGPDLPNPWA
jgi:predicted double-glycine peptidase